MDESHSSKHPPHDTTGREKKALSAEQHRHNSNAEGYDEREEDRLVDDRLAHRSTTLPSTFFLNLLFLLHGKRRGLRSPITSFFLTLATLAFTFISKAVFFL